MRLSVARAHARGGHGSTHGGDGTDEPRSGPFDATMRRLALALSLVLLLGAIGLLFSPAKAGAGTSVLAPTQVFASVGASTVNVYTPGTPATTGSPAVGPNLVTSLNDGSMIPASSPVYPGYPSADNTAGSAFDANGNFYVTDDYSGQISEYDPNGNLTGIFASGLQNPLSLVFDNRATSTSASRTRPTSPSSTRAVRPWPTSDLSTTGETGDDWIDLASDQCTFDYTTETNVIYRYNKCTSTQESNFNAVPFAGARAFQVRILPDGGALVADTNSVLRLDANGNVTEVYACTAADQSALESVYPTANVVAPLPDCGGSLFSLAIDPSGTSFWAGDSYSGNIWQIDLSSGQLLNEVNTGAAFLYGLSVENGSEAAVTPPPAATPTAITPPSIVGPGTFTYGTQTPVQATLTNPSTGLPISGEPVTFTLNGNSLESCTNDTNAPGVASCNITPIEPSNTYTLTASFGGDTSTSTPSGANDSSEHVPGEPRHQFLDLQRAHDGRQRPDDHAVRHPDGHHDGHPAALARTSTSPSVRAPPPSPATPGRRIRTGSSAANSSVEPAGEFRADHGQLRRRLLRHPRDPRESDHAQCHRTDHPDGQPLFELCRLRLLRSTTVSGVLTDASTTPRSQESRSPSR